MNLINDFDFDTKNLLVKAFERYATSYVVWGTDVWGNKISERIEIGSGRSRRSNLIQTARS